MRSLYRILFKITMLSSVCNFGSGVVFLPITGRTAFGLIIVIRAYQCLSKGSDPVSVKYQFTSVHDVLSKYLSKSLMY